MTTHLWSGEGPTPVCTAQYNDAKPSSLRHDLKEVTCPQCRYKHIRDRFIRPLQDARARLNIFYSLVLSDGPSVEFDSGDLDMLQDIRDTADLCLAQLTEKKA